MKRIPKYILLVGWPKSGKDEISRIISQKSYAMPIDDAYCLRQAAPMLFGYDKTLPFSQDGKTSNVQTPVGNTTVRKTLGDLGKALEAFYGTGFIPRRAMMMAEDMNLPHIRTFVVSSCRRDQARYYPENDRVCIEVTRPSAEPSEYDFDQWDQRYVDCRINNNGSIEQLEKAINHWLFTLPVHGIRDLDVRSFQYD